MNGDDDETKLQGFANYLYKITKTSNAKDI